MDSTAVVVDDANTPTTTIRSTIDPPTTTIDSDCSTTPKTSSNTTTFTPDGTIVDPSSTSPDKPEMNHDTVINLIAEAIRAQCQENSTTRLASSSSSSCDPLDQQLEKFLPQLSDIGKSVLLHDSLPSCFNLHFGFVDYFTEQLDKFIAGKETRYSLGSVFNAAGDMKPFLLDVSLFTDQDLLGFKSLLNGHDYATISLWEHFEETLLLYKKNNWELEKAIDFATDLPIRQRQRNKSIWLISYYNKAAWEVAHTKPEYRSKAIIKMASDVYAEIETRYADWNKELEDASISRFNNFLYVLNNLLDNNIDVAQRGRGLSRLNFRNKTVLTYVDEVLCVDSKRDITKLIWLRKNFVKYGVSCEFRIERSYHLLPTNMSSLNKKRFEVVLSKASKQQQQQSMFQIIPLSIMRSSSQNTTTTKPDQGVSLSANSDQEKTTPKPQVAPDRRVVAIDEEVCAVSCCVRHSTDKDYEDGEEEDTEDHITEISCSNY